MTVNGVDVVEQLRGRMRFYHVGDPVRRDMKDACDTINELLGVQLRETHTAASVGDWLEERGIKLLPWQRKRLGLAPTPKVPRKAMNT
jgi:DNA primase